MLKAGIVKRFKHRLIAVTTFVLVLKESDITAELRMPARNVQRRRNHSTLMRDKLVRSQLE